MGRVLVHLFREVGNPPVPREKSRDVSHGGHMKKRQRRLSRLQQELLATLATDDYRVTSISDLAKAWPHWNENSVRGSMDRLWRRGLVDTARMETSYYTGRMVRMWSLTDAGRTWLAENVPPPLPDET